MKVGDTLRFVALVKAPLAADTTVTWRSSNTAWVTVDNTGLATALAVGTAAVVAMPRGDTTQGGAAEVRVHRKP